MMKTSEPQSFFATLDILSRPLTEGRVDLDQYTVMTPAEVAIQESDLTNALSAAAHPSPKLMRSLALKAVSGTMKATERAELIFGNHLQIASDSVDAAIMYGAVSNSVRIRRNSLTTFQAAEEAGFVTDLTTIGKATDPQSGVSFVHNGKEHTYTHERHNNAAGFLWAMGDALIKTSGLELSRPPLDHAKPNLTRPTAAVTAYLRARQRRYHPMANLYVKDPAKLENMAYNHALLLSGNGAQISAS